MKTDHQTRTYDSILDLLSSEDNPTPLVRLNRVVPKGIRIFAKLEWYNPFGAVKDRIAANLLDDAEKKGDLKSIKKLVEPTSGNTGLALTMLANARGYSLKSPLSSEIPLEKRVILRFFGCDVLEMEDTLCPAPGAPEGAIAKAHEFAQQSDFHMLDQYSNEANPQAHYKTTGPEIWKQTDHKITHFVAALGTCGTITGTGSFLKEKNPKIKLIGVHPQEGHDIPGVRSIRQLQQTKLFRPNLYDTLVEVSNKDSYDMCLRLNREESIIAGPSSGLALVGALQVIQDNPDATVVVIFPDNIFKYASSIQRHFPDMFSTTIGSSSNRDNKNKKEELLNRMIELARNEMNTINQEDAAELRKQKIALFVDVRPKSQYDAGHVKGAIHIPMESFKIGHSQLPENHDQQIITVCNKGNLSMSGMLVLKSMGYKNTRSLNGGTTAWREKGDEIEKGSS